MCPRRDPAVFEHGGEAGCVWLPQRLRGPGRVLEEEKKNLVWFTMGQVLTGRDCLTVFAECCIGFHSDPQSLLSLSHGFKRWRSMRMWVLLV